MDREARWTRRDFLRNSASAAVLLGGTVVLGACSNSSSPPSSSSSGGSSEPATTLDKIKAAQEVTIGYDSDPPWSFATESGEVTGIAYEVAVETFKLLGVPTVQASLVNFGQLIPGLIAGRFDSIGDALFITSDRCKQVLFSDPFVVDGEAFAVAQGNPLNISDYDSIAANSQIRLGLIGGSAESVFANDAGVSSSQLTTFDDLSTGIEAIGAGRVDAVGFDVVALQYTVSTTKKTNVEVTPAFTAMVKGKPQYGASAFIFRQDDTEFRDAFNSAQQQLLDSGKVSEICKQFAGDLDPGIEQAQKLSVDQLCNG
jgi:polar amino acid transport system substrate-binding protein